MNLSDLSTEELASELARRPDLIDANGIMTDAVYKLHTLLAPVICVDGLPVRKNSGIAEAGFIRRNTGFYSGKLWVIGGRVTRGESVEDALRRHFRETLGVSISFYGAGNVAALGQYMFEDRYSAGNFGHDPSKYTIAPMFLVTMLSDAVTFGSTPYGGQEASGLEWFPISSLPAEDEFAYKGYKYVVKALASMVE